MRSPTYRLGMACDGIGDFVVAEAPHPSILRASAMVPTLAR